ncbi:hypothetical protein CL617_04680 [archaeon]|nr:hypothetical protein [archaeon]|tara:strand:+ start:2342 stop:2731 length:390 start_codon:yes stop_codon:yes gene_type:complete
MTIKLRPHHVERIIKIKEKGFLINSAFSLMARLIYGSKTLSNYKNTLKRIESGEKISLTRQIGDLCKDCPYQKPCIIEDYDSATKLVHYFLRKIGGKIGNTKILDDNAIVELSLNEDKTYCLDDLINSK